jgi:uncharacterized repeat protein (TIGR01451 family)
MKRLALRIGALGTIIALGFIAIAHAQRGVDKPAVAIEPTSSVRMVSPEGSVRPALAAASTPINPLRPEGYEPAAAASMNSLRPEDYAPAAADPPPAAATTTGSAARIGAVRPQEQLMPSAVLDPFGDRAGQGRSPVVAASGTTAIPDERAPASQEPADIAGPAMPPYRVARGDGRYGEPTGSAAAPPAGPMAAARGSAMPNPSAKQSASDDSPPAGAYTNPAGRSDRYSASSPAAADVEEPNALRVDPFAKPAGMPRQMESGAVRRSGSGASSVASGGAAAQAAAMPANSGGIPDAAALESASASEGTGKPGDKQLDGPQSPQLTVQKFAPDEIQVGKSAKFRVLVRNVGQVAAAGVEVHDQIPQGTRVVATQPHASRGVHGELVWTLGTIKPGEESSVESELMPVSEGEIGSVATVVFSAEASARTIATRPQLVLESAAPERVTIGEELTLSITISNPGSGVATGVVVEEHIPAGLQHPAGSQLQYEVGPLRPGESRKLDLTLVASRPGPLTNILSAHGDGSLQAENRRNLEVVAPQLSIAVDGPKKRYLEREATYQLSVSNPGTAPAQQVDLVAYLPTGLKFVSANNGGHYHEADRAVSWRLEELPINETGTVALVAMPVEPGPQAIKLRGTAQKGLKVEKEQPGVIEGIAAMLFQASVTANPIAVGGETTFEIHVVNQGSKAASNVQMAVILPPEMKPIAAEGPTRNSVEGNRILFEGLAQLAAKADTTYRVRAQGLKPGDLRTRIQLLTDEMQSPVTKEESTRVYADE